MTDEDQIREMIVKWALADANKDVDGFAAVFTEEGRFRNKRGESQGRDALRQNLAHRTAVSPSDRETMHLFGEGIVRIDGEHATLVSPYVAYGRIGDGPWEVMTIGRFHCELVKNEGSWLFSDMENRSDWTAQWPGNVGQVAVLTAGRFVAGLWPGRIRVVGSTYSAFGEVTHQRVRARDSLQNRR